MVLYRRAGKPISFILTIILTLLLTGCGSSDSDHNVVSFSGESISGKVADGYVNGATLTVYSCADLTEENVIGTGTTDANGAFSITLSTTTVPDPIYIKSEGGTDIDLGLPAPVMLFAGSADGNGSYNVTPLTDMVYKYIGVQGSLNASQAFLTGVLGISADDLGADPVENATAGVALTKVLASGTQGSTLSTGEYTMHLLYFEREDLGEVNLPDLAAVTARIIALPITVNADGSIEEEFEGIDFDHDGEDDVLELSGAVIGGSLFLGIDVNDEEDNAMVMTLGGEVGLFGSLSGRCYLRSEGIFGGGFRQGVFVATFTPVGITEGQKTAMFQQLGAIMGSDEVSYLLFSDVLIGNVIDDGANKPQISYGTVVLAQDGANGFDYSALTMNSIKYNAGGDAVEEESVWDAAGGDLDYIGASEQTRILAVRQGDTYLIIPGGGRKGVSVTVDGGHNILKAGQVFFNRSDSLAPVLEAGTDYTLAQAFMGTSVLATVPRADALEQVVPETFPSLSVPASGGKAFGSVYNADSGEIFAVSGGFLALKNDANEFFADAGDYLTTLEMYETGALAGVRLNAGAWWVPGGGDAYQTPIGAVMFACKDGDPAPAFKGTMKFLAREFLGGAVFNEIPAWTAGKLTINIDGGVATGTGLLTVEYIDGCGYDPDDPIGGDSFGEAVQNFPSVVSMQVERIGPSNSGLLHIYGTGTYSLYFIDQDSEDKEYYWDIYWPIGAPKGVYMFSYRDNEGVFTVNEIGEASVTY